jgi:hypothetical protein
MGLVLLHNLINHLVFLYERLTDENFKQAIALWFDLWSRCCRQHGFVDGMKWNGIGIDAQFNCPRSTDSAAIAISSDNKFVVLTDSQSLDKEWCTSEVKLI